jgi:prepilin-type processing-associated H-X9-DG protein
MARTQTSRRTRRGYTVKELIAVVFILGILAGILIPIIQDGRKSARKSQCANNLRLIGMACQSHQDAQKELPTGGMEIDLETLEERLAEGKPPQEVIGMRSTFDVIDDFLHGKGASHVYDWRKAYNDPSAPKCTLPGHRGETWNSYQAKQQWAELLCPANPYVSVRDPAGYGKTDYMPTTFTDIDPVPNANKVVGLRNAMTTESGCLSVYGTPLDAITDGTSNTIMIAESAGRLPESRTPHMCGEFPDPVCDPGVRQREECPKSMHRAFWRWAEPTCAGGISGQRNFLSRGNDVAFVNGNKTPVFGGTAAELPGANCLTPPAEGKTPTCLWTWTNCGPNDEIFGWHTGGANVVMADGAVRLVQSNVRPDVLRYLITRAEAASFPPISPSY